MLFLGILSMIITLPYWIQCRSMPTDVTVAKDGTGNFSSVKDAIAAAPNYQLTRFYIRIKEGSYIENIIFGKEKRNIAIIGDGIGKTVISGNRSRGSGISTYMTATVGELISLRAVTDIIRVMTFAFFYLFFWEESCKK